MVVSWSSLLGSSKGVLISGLGVARVGDGVVAILVFDGDGDFERLEIWIPWVVGLGAVRVVRTGFDGDGGFGVRRRGAGFRGCSTGSWGDWFMRVACFREGGLFLGWGGPGGVPGL